MVRQLLALVHGQVALLVEGDLALAHQVDALAGTDALQRRRNDVRVDLVRAVAFQPQQHGLVGAVATAGQGQRAEHLGADADHVLQTARIQQPAVHEALGRAHGAHGV
ncbi:hypothetical protein D3C71_1579300 [compost metagenome]